MRYQWSKSRPILHNFKKGWRAANNLETKGLVIHISDGTSLNGIVGQFNKVPPPPDADGKKHFGASAHFAIGKDGEVWQLLDTDDRAQAVGGDDATDGKWLSVENVALRGEILTEDQIEECAWLLAWMSATFGFPLALATNRNDYGLGYHTMFGNTNHGCPGPKVVSQLPEILKRGKDYLALLREED